MWPCLTYLLIADSSSPSSFPNILCSFWLPGLCLCHFFYPEDRSLQIIFQVSVLVSSSPGKSPVMFIMTVTPTHTRAWDWCSYVFHEHLLWWYHIPPIITWLPPWPVYKLHLGRGWLMVITVPMADGCGWDYGSGGCSCSGCLVICPKSSWVYMQTCAEMFCWGEEFIQAAGSLVWNHILSAEAHEVAVSGSETLKEKLQEAPRKSRGS